MRQTSGKLDLLARLFVVFSEVGEDAGDLEEIEQCPEGRGNCIDEYTD